MEKKTVLSLVISAFSLGIMLVIIIQGYVKKNITNKPNLKQNIELKWEGLDKDIPEIGKTVIVTRIEENIVYLNNVKK